MLTPVLPERLLAIEKYRIINPIMVLYLEDGVRVAHSVNEGTVITIERDGYERLVKVVWESHEGFMFGLDLATRAEKID